MSDRFNEAEAFTPRIFTRKQGVEGWEKSFNEAEAFTPRIPIIQLLGQPALAEASMKPRLLHLGYYDATKADDTHLGASMRPRLLHLGYPEAVSLTGCRKSLLQ